MSYSIYGPELAQWQGEEQLYRAKIKLLENNYEPIPIVGKRTHIKGWTTGDITVERIVTETLKYRDHINTGLRTGRLAAPDIDLWDDDHADNIRRLTEEFLGETPLRRRGAKGYVLCYHNVGEPTGKLIIKNTETDKTLVEIFGHGGQFVAFGIHPDTKQPYRWLVEGKNPFTVQLGEVPEVTPEKLHELHKMIADRLAALGYPVKGCEKKVAANLPAAGRIEDAGTIAEKFIRLVPSQRRTSARGFINFRCPSCHCDDGRSGLLVTASGGFRYHCFHSGCAYHEATGWEPGGFIGQRTRDLYSLMGGDPKELRRRPKIEMKGICSLAEMMADWRKDNE